FRQLLRVETTTTLRPVLNDQRRQPPEIRISEKRRCPLRAVLCVSVHPHFDIALSPQRRHVVDRQRHASRRGARRGWTEPKISRTQLQRHLPYGKPFGNLLGEFRRIG